MKMNVFIKIALAAAAAAMVSCSKENNYADEPGASDQGTVTFRALMTKTAFGALSAGKYPTLWTDNDANIKVMQNLSGAVDAPVTPSGDYKNATFTASMDADGSGSYTFQAISPASAYSACDAGAGTVTVVIPAAQTPLTGSVDESAQLLFAQSSTTSVFPSNVDISFNHLTAYGKIDISGFTLAVGETISKVQLVASSNWVGTYAYDVSSDTMSEVDGSKIITLSTDRLTDLWFACAPVNLGGTSFGVVVTTSKGVRTKTVTLPSKSFTAGTVSQFSIAFEKGTPSTAAVWTMSVDNMKAKNGNALYPETGWAESDNTGDKTYGNKLNHYIYSDAGTAAFMTYDHLVSGSSNTSYYIILNKDGSDPAYVVYQSRYGANMEIEVPVSDVPAGSYVRLKMGILGNNNAIKNWNVGFSTNAIEWQQAPYLYQSGKAFIKLEKDTKYTIDCCFVVPEAIVGAGTLHFRLVNYEKVAIGTYKESESRFRILGSYDDGTMSVTLYK